MSTAPVTLPNDPNFASQWYLQNSSTSGIDAPAAWSVTTGSKNVVIAVLDSGINLNDPDLKNNIWTNPGIVSSGITNDIHGWNFVNNSSNVADNFGHGTAVATIIGAEGNNGLGNTGVDWHVTILPVEIGTAAGVTDQSLINGINYVIGLKQKGVNIVAINASYLSFSFPGLAAMNAVQNAGNNGILYVAAAGNNAMNLDTVIPSGFLPSNMIMVGAIDNQNKLASFSNYGAHSVAVGAPGVNVLTNFNGLYLPLSGTSFAAPMVSGIIGLLKAAVPNATMLQLKNAILNSGVADPALVGKTITGRRVDAYSALEYLLGGFVAPSPTTTVTTTTNPSSIFNLSSFSSFSKLLNLRSLSSITHIIKLPSQTTPTVPTTVTTPTTPATPAAPSVASGLGSIGGSIVQDIVSSITNKFKNLFHF